MKKALFFILFPILCFGQEFLDDNNQWVYKRLSMRDVSYFQYTWGEETIINNHMLKELEVSLIRYAGDPYGGELTRLEDIALDSYFIKVVNGLVQYYHEATDEFHPMFLLNPEMGEEISMIHSVLFPCADENYPGQEVQTVDSLATEMISNTEINYYTLVDQESLSVGEKVYNQIGGSMSLFPMPSMNCESWDNNLYMPEKIVCFSNNNLNLNFSPSEQIPCSELLNTSEFELQRDNEIRIVPNPILSNFKVVSTFDVEEAIKVYTINGEYAG
ncbi:hypothetical protein NMK71_10750 [Weeksellaceae bacterium KMM 9713]|uniref:Uncharacterized protein n=1 Tax=Profundicola chukchiensis TaxID=2961959 RepID=A0A9X4MXW5_9FLAO|nr:hypothetical protein [Profundicola chukchiensis]MDG4946896.1 hypothetical protein [Profundicola chukchiensis]